MTKRTKTLKSNKISSRKDNEFEVIRNETLIILCENISFFFDITFYISLIIFIIIYHIDRYKIKQISIFIIFIRYVIQKKKKVM